MADKEKQGQEVRMVDVPSGYARMIELPDGTQLDAEQYLVWLGNQILAIRKAVA